jgi:hypothetical protein
MLATFAETIHRRARLVLVLSAGVLVVMGVLGVGAFGQLKTGGFDATAPSRLAPHRSATTPSAGRRTWFS